MRANNILDTIGNTPHVKTSRLFPSSHSVWIKLERANPGGSIKDRAALGIIQQAEKDGLLKPGHTIVEGTAGNTGIGITLVANARGYRSVIVMPETQSQEKKDMLRLCGADLRLVRGETREFFNYSAGRFTRERTAGGRQSFLGLFLLREQAVAPGWRVTGGLRGDLWREGSGLRREGDRETGAVLRNDLYPGARGSVPGPHAGLVWTPAAGWRRAINWLHSVSIPTSSALTR